MPCLRLRGRPIACCHTLSHALRCLHVKLVPAHRSLLRGQVVKAHLQRDSRLIVPVGCLRSVRSASSARERQRASWKRSPPGFRTEFGVLRAPAINVRRQSPDRATLCRRTASLGEKTLHRTMNDLLEQLGGLWLHRVRASHGAPLRSTCGGDRHRIGDISGARAEFSRSSPSISPPSCRARRFPTRTAAR
jgi:hypothetical protein